MTEFFLTVMGRRFYESTMPQLVEQLSRLNHNLEAYMAREDARCAAAKEVMDAQLVEAERFLATMKKEQEEKLAKEWEAIPVPEEDEEPASQGEDINGRAIAFTRCPKCKEVHGWVEDKGLEGQVCECCSYVFNGNEDPNGCNGPEDEDELRGS